MNWKDWEPIYLTIVDRLHLDPYQDRKATELLTEMLSPVDPTPLIAQLYEMINDKTIVICGAGPSLERHIQEMIERKECRDAIYVAADGAVSVLLDNNCQCGIIATDLDGDLDHIKEAAERGAQLIVHGHGDNIEKISDIVPTLEQVLGSTQVEPTYRTFLWGGFTDGDRACHIVSDYSPKQMILAGMDFGRIVGKWSKPNQDSHFPATERKMIKLGIAQDLISSLFRRVNIPYVILE
ncbi:DUF115 domain-containing protein [Candidatus Thorarchaeota archaeon]|nr:MAG: DUF115 domain-containing protein [Candidatus Thorarchaeota archaeon]